MNAVNQTISIAIYIQTAAAWLFIAEYQRRTRGAWRHSIGGAHLMSVTFAEALFATEVTIAHIWPWIARTWAFRWSLVSVVALGALIVVWRLGILVIVQPRRDRDESDR